MREVFIGGASGFWGDTDEATAQLLRAPRLDFLVYDYLSEVTLGLLARVRAREPEAGFVPDFVRAVTPHLATLKARGVRVLSNAGGLNPLACARALEQAAAAAGLDLKVAAVLGDEVLDRVPAGAPDMFTGAPTPPRLLTANAYLGAGAMVAALDAGADIVVTGRCADSALTLAPLVHAFGWGWDELDRLAQGSLAGHLIECGAQGVGGLFTDWREVEGWEEMGFPIAVCREDGVFDLTRPGGTGGLITPLSAAEQLVYEIGDPADYRLPDVTCDFRDVRIEAVGPERVRVSGARGRPAPETAKVCVTWPDGWRLNAAFMIGGMEARAKAVRVGETLLARAERLAARAGHGPFTRRSLEVLGAEWTYGPHGRADDAREVILKLAAAHPERAPLEILSREIFPAATALCPGITGAMGGRPKPTPLVRTGGVRLDWAEITPRVVMAGASVAVPPRPRSGGATVAPGPAAPASEPPAAAPPPAGARRLVDLAVGRSGDKGDILNVGVVARSPEAWAWLRAHLTAERVGDHLAHLGASRCERFELPGLRALNFVLHDALDGGGLASLRHDPQGKAVAQMLLDIPVA